MTIWAKKRQRPDKRGIVSVVLGKGKQLSLNKNHSTIDSRCNKKNENGNEQQQLFEYPNNDEECVVDVNGVGSE